MLRNLTCMFIYPFNIATLHVFRSSYTIHVSKEISLRHVRSLSVCESTCISIHNLFRSSIHNTRIINQKLKSCCSIDFILHRLSHRKNRHGLGFPFPERWPGIESPLTRGRITCTPGPIFQGKTKLS